MVTGWQTIDCSVLTRQYKFHRQKSLKVGQGMDGLRQLGKRFGAA
jgi:hypothetical protein